MSSSSKEPPRGAAVAGPTAETLSRSTRGSAGMVIRAARHDEAPAIATLLREAGLPHEDVAPHLAYFLVARDGFAVVGAIGVEVAGEDALLRSLVVAPARRGEGLGGQLMAALERAAGQWRVKRWWLLTTTAETFFASRGFAVASRASAPPGIQRTAQFAGGCCAAAVCLTRERKTP
jgi:amino-acid N-acetyltransferase